MKTDSLLRLVLSVLRVILLA